VATFVMVPGGWQGGWAFEPVLPLLRAAGHEASAVTLSGLEIEDLAHTPTPNLDTHVQDVLTAVNSAEDRQVVLCGHSYGGFPITGAADVVPDRVRALVYIDAYVPDHGDSCWSRTTDAFRQRFLDGARRDGRVTDPVTGMDERARPHPMASFLQSIRLTGGISRIRHRHALWHTGWEGSPFTEQFARLRDDPSWTVHEVDVAHNIMRVAPERLSAILVDIAQRLGD